MIIKVRLTANFPSARTAAHVSTSGRRTSACATANSPRSLADTVIWVSSIHLIISISYKFIIQTSNLWIESKGYRFKKNGSVRFELKSPLYWQHDQIAFGLETASETGLLFRLHSTRAKKTIVVELVTDMIFFQMFFFLLIILNDFQSNKPKQKGWRSDSSATERRSRCRVQPLVWRRADAARQRQTLPRGSHERLRAQLDAERRRHREHTPAHLVVVVVLWRLSATKANDAERLRLQQVRASLPVRSERGRHRSRRPLQRQHQQQRLSLVAYRRHKQQQQHQQRRRRVFGSFDCREQRRRGGGDQRGRRGKHGLRRQHLRPRLQPLQVRYLLLFVLICCGRKYLLIDFDRWNRILDLLLRRDSRVKKFGRVTLIVDTAQADAKKK